MALLPRGTPVLYTDPQGNMYGGIISGDNGVLSEVTYFAGSSVLVSWPVPASTYIPIGSATQIPVTFAQLIIPPSGYSTSSIITDSPVFTFGAPVTVGLGNYVVPVYWDRNTSLWRVG